MTRPYPAHPDQLTPEWLTSALGAAGTIDAASVISLTTTPVGEGSSWSDRAENLRVAGRRTRWPRVQAVQSAHLP